MSKFNQNENSKTNAVISYFLNALPFIIVWAVMFVQLQDTKQQVADLQYENNMQNDKLNELIDAHNAAVMRARTALGIK